MGGVYHIAVLPRKGLSVYLYVEHIDISFVSQSSWEKEEASIDSRTALVVALPGVVDSVLAAPAAWLRRPPPVEREGMKGVSRLSTVAWAV